MSKPRISIDKILTKAAEEAVETAIDRINEPPDSSSENPLFDSPFNPEEKSPEVHPVIDDFLSRAKEEGYYFKLSRDTDGKNESLGDIARADYESWSDIESDLHNYVKLKTKAFYPRGWGSGKYTLKLHRRGVPGIIKDSSVNVYYFNCAEEEAYALGRISNPTSQIIADKSKDISETVELIKTLSGVLPSTNPNETTKLASESFKAGISAAQTTNHQSSSDSDLLKILLPLIQPSKVDANQIVKDTISMLKDMGVIGQPKQDDFFNQYIKMKELGLIKDKEEDSLGMVEKVAKVIEAVGNITGNNGGNNSPVSLGVEIIKNLSPHVPAVVEKITGAVHDVTEVHKLRLMRSMNVNPADMHKEALPPTVEPSINNSGENQMFFMHPLLKELHGIIQANDTSKYDYILVKIADNIPQGVALIDGIKTGELTDLQLHQTLVSIGGNPFNNNQTLTYVRGLIAHVKATVHEEETYVAICNKCRVEYEFPTENEFKNDDKVCGALLPNGSTCDGSLKPYNSGNGKDESFVPAIVNEGA